MFLRAFIVSVRRSRRFGAWNVEVYGIPEVGSNPSFEIPPNCFEILKRRIRPIYVNRPGESRMRIRQMPGLSGGFVDDSGVARFVPSK